MWQQNRTRRPTLYRVQAEVIGLGLEVLQSPYLNYTGNHCIRRTWKMVREQSWLCWNRSTRIREMDTVEWMLSNRARQNVITANMMKLKFWIPLSSIVSAACLPRSSYYIFCLKKCSAVTSLSLPSFNWMVSRRLGVGVDLRTFKCRYMGTWTWKDIGVWENNAVRGM